MSRRKSKKKTGAILRYIKEDLDNPSAAFAVLEDILQAYSLLETNAKSFALSEDPFLAKHGFRRLKLRNHNYLLIYQVSGDTVYIKGIFHAKENYYEKL